jgi:phosphoribosyl 1,2-cyclic phosphate phosphodiesterase
MPLSLTFLGTGTSAGVPMIGCDCPVCRSDDPRDRRDRASVLIRFDDPSISVEAEHTTFNPAQAGIRQVLFDPSPDLRHQAIRAALSRLDAVLVTHAHADHVFGLDDLRRFNATMQAPIDLYAEPSVLNALQSKMFNYIFEPHKNPNKSFIAQLIAHRIEAGQPFKLFGTSFTPLRLLHGRLPILGFRVDHAGRSLAYCTDVSKIPPETFTLLDDLDLLIIDALRYRHHPTHLTVDQAVETAERVGARQTYLTHLAHDLQHQKLLEQLPPGVAPAYDGLVIDLQPGADTAPDPA